jgi:succinate dehydrogenase/fumarate reductase flavoprotein subunit
VRDRRRLTGVNTAMELAERGLSVVLLEARRIGWGASGRNGGQLIRGIGHDVSGFARHVGQDGVRYLKQAGIDSVALVASASPARHRLRPALGLLRTGQHPGAVRRLQGRTATWPPGLSP